MDSYRKRATSTASTPRSPFLYPQPEDVISTDDTFVLDSSLRDRPTSGGDWHSVFSTAAPAISESIAEEPDDITDENTNNATHLDDQYPTEETTTTTTTTTISSSFKQRSSFGLAKDSLDPRATHFNHQDSTLALEDMDSDEYDTSDLEDDSETVHVEGLPRSYRRLEARAYSSNAFAESLMELLQKDLSVTGWESLPATSGASDLIPSLNNNPQNSKTTSPHTESYSALHSQLSIFKISGALTNAVFFVSAPNSDSTPTVLLRVYGPSSGSLISRKKELHILHTLSSIYGIGPLVLGTFGNGRVEEHFNSRALTKEELRSPKMRRWIARRMKELHSVSIDAMLPPDDPARGNIYRNSSCKSKESSSSLQSIDSNISSSAFSLNSSAHPSPSLAPISGGPVRRLSLASTGSGSFRSPPGVAQGPAVRKRRRSNLNNRGRSDSIESNTSNMVYSTSLTSQNTSNSNNSKEGYNITDSFGKLRINNSAGRCHSRTGRRRTRRDNLCVWDNLSRWSKLAKSVLQEVEKLVAVVKNKDTQYPTGNATWLDSAELLVSFLSVYDVDNLVSDLKTYKEWVINQDVLRGGGFGSKIVFCHNDTQYGNVLLATEEDWHEKNRIRPRQPHERIVVIDFEYAGANPRAYDMANYFCEWQADYHHPTLSYSLSHHLPYPSVNERLEFYRAYLGMDGGADRTDDNEEEEDGLTVEQASFLAKLDEEVEQWKPVSDGLWSLWAIIQASIDIKYRVNYWIHQDNLRKQNSDDYNVDGKEQFPEADFDYLKYAMDRAKHFRNRQPPPFPRPAASDSR